MIKAILFDLDDTLYPEIAYFRGAFAEVADFLSRRGFGPDYEILLLLEHIYWEIDRDRVFNHAASRLGFDEAWIPKLINMVRTHQPEISLPDETRRLLRELCRDYRLGIVTNGHGDIQRRKLAALKLEDAVDAVVICDDMGRQLWKPHPLAFLTACHLLKTSPEHVLFVGDHPRRDIWGAKQVGMRTVRVRRNDGYYRQLPNLQDAPPDDEVLAVEELMNLDIVNPSLSVHSHERPGCPHELRAAA